jgi:hypothetical protein
MLKVNPVVMPILASIVFWAITAWVFLRLLA